MQVSACRRVLLALLILSLFTQERAIAAAQAQREPVGALRATGEVYVGNTRVTGEWTVFAGDAVRTGADGAAGVRVAQRGVLVLGPGTEITLDALPRHFATLKHGNLGLQSVAEGRGFQLRVGNFTVVPSPETEAAAEIERAADGATRVTCTKGSFGVFEIDGEASVFLRAGETAFISPQGQLQATRPTTAPPREPVPQPTGKRRTGVVVAVVVAAGAAGAAVALAGRGAERQPVSPSGP